MTETTVASYLKTRLEQLGLERIFAVNGNYSAVFLDIISADPDSPIAISGNVNELCAGFAADGYARTKGVGALYVNDGAGALTLLDTLAGSYSEQVPVILINGVPASKETSNTCNSGTFYAYPTGPMVDIHMFRPITVAAERISDAVQAPDQIDSALTTLIASPRPVYLEITEDTWSAPCRAPEGFLDAEDTLEDMVKLNNEVYAVSATVALMRRKPKTLFWAGVELQRLGLVDAFLGLLHAINQHVQPGQEIQFVTSALSKSVIGEDNPYFAGCVSMGKPDIQSLLGADGCVIGIGAGTVGKDTGYQNMRDDNIVLAARGGVFVGADYFPSVNLQSFILRLEDAFSALSAGDAPSPTGLRLNKRHPPCAIEPLTLGYDSFFNALGGWLGDEDILIADAGFSLLGAQSVKIRPRGGFVAQAAWLATGYSVAAATGVKCAHPDKRVMVVVGDGALQETYQALEDHRAYGQNTVVFVLANGLGGVEPCWVKANLPSALAACSDATVHEADAYSDLPKSPFDQLADAFGSLGRTVSSLKTLLSVLAEIRSRPQESFLVTLKIPNSDVPAGIRGEWGQGGKEDHYPKEKSLKASVGLEVAVEPQKSRYLMAIPKEA